MRVSWRGTSGLVMSLSGVSGLVGLMGLVGFEGELMETGRREVVEVDETRFDCDWPILLQMGRTPRIF